MLRRLRVQGFKSLADVELEFPAFTVLFGPNAAGKSNLLDALLVLSRIATSQTLADALSEPARGQYAEFFTFPEGGLPRLLRQEYVEFTLGADFHPQAGDEKRSKREDPMRYRVAVRMEPPRSGELRIADEFLCRLSRDGQPKGKADIEVESRQISIRRPKRPGRPRKEPLGLNYSTLSDRRFVSPEYPTPERARKELSEFRTYYLDPRVAMRRAVPPKQVRDIGPLGEDLAPFLYALQAPGDEKRFKQVVRTLKTIIPAVESLSVDLDERRGTLDIQIVQEGTTFSSRIISEGTLRVLALAALAVNPWRASLIAFEEPENGVHPRRLELIAKLLASLALEGGQQVIVTTHSPLFCQEALRHQRGHPKEVALIVVRQVKGKTTCSQFQPSGPLYEDSQIRAALTSPVEDGWFEALALRGFVDG